MVTPGEDVLCQWCHSVVFVSLSDTKGHVAVKNSVEYQEKFYCEEPCYRNLKAMAKYVRRSL